MSRGGPLAGVKVLEIQSIGPGPFAAMLLADLGADVLRISRPDGASGRRLNPVLDRGRSGRLCLDLKSPAGRDRVLQLLGKADVLIEGYRPGVMERLGLGPEPCLAANPCLIYGRITGWGRHGPLAHTAGHDINYIALSGVLHACGAESGPQPPLNLVGDFGGGGLLLAFGLVCALLEARQSGRGQVVDSAMLDGANILMSMIHGFRVTGRWPAERAGNIFDGSAYFYTCYTCADGKWVAVGAIEPEFRRQLFDKLGLGSESEDLLRAPDQDPTVRARLAAIFAGKTRAQWQAVFEGNDACVTPVLSLDEAPHHPHNRAWQSLIPLHGQHVQASPAPRFSRTPAPDPSPVTAAPFADSDWGLTAEELRPL